MAEIVSIPEEMVDKKMNAVFKYHDQNGDGLLTKDDFEKAAQMFLAIAEDNDQKSKDIMREGYGNWWQMLEDSRDDKTSEGIDSQEYIRIMKTVAPRNFESTLGIIVDGLISALDRDKNGVLSQEEYLELYNRLEISARLSPTMGIEAFKRLDRDGDGVISHEEFRQATIEFFTSGDPNAPGQWLLGAPQKLE